MEMDKMKDIWKQIEEFLTTIPKVILYMLLIISFFLPLPFFLIVIVLFCFNKEE